MKRIEWKNVKMVLMASCLTVALLGGCASTSLNEQIRVPETPKYINAPSQRTVPVQTSDGSLYVDGTRHAQINDFRAYDINDLVQIRVVESTSAVNNAGLSTERSNASKRSLTSLLGLQDRILPRSVRSYFCS
jgi:flagellar basal body L-ring protein FlgH